ncbi:MAG: hypothetical protein ACK4IK_04610 [Bacteroidia bacterium]
MKTLFASIILLLGLFSSAIADGNIQNTYKKTSLVIIKIDKPNSATVSKAVALTAKYQGMSHEYSCSTSGIIVYRYNHNLNERADVIQFFQKILAKEISGIKTEIVFCDIMSNENIGKC